MELGMNLSQVPASTYDAIAAGGGCRGYLRHAESVCATEHKSRLHFFVVKIARVDIRGQLRCTQGIGAELPRHVFGDPTRFAQRTL